MNYKFSPKKAFAVLCTFFLTNVSVAENDGWLANLLANVQSHPEVIAAKETWISSDAQSKAMSQPLYNPEIVSDYERSGNDNNFRVGVQQTFDWWDKQGARTQQADFLREASASEYQQAILDNTAEALSALSDFEAAKKELVLLNEQKAQLDELLSLVQKRQAYGDIGMADAELTVLSLSAQMKQVTDVENELNRAEIRVKELLPNWTFESAIPASFWSNVAFDTSEQALLEQPSVLAAKARWKALVEEAEVARRAAKAEPTVGVNVGRDGQDNVIGLSFSMPLNVRNNYSAEVQSAESLALSAEAQFNSIYRQQKYELEAAQTTWSRLNQQYQTWQSMTQQSSANSASVLQRQWVNGDLSTAEYLLSLNQRIDSLLVGVDLERQTNAEYIQLLVKSGQLADEINLAQLSTRASIK